MQEHRVDLSCHVIKYKTFKNETTAAITRTRRLMQRPSPPEPIEKIYIAMEDVAAALESFSATLAQRKQQRE